MRLLLLTVLFFISFQNFAQQTYVPDDNFEAYLEGNGMGNGTPNDDYVTTANISGVTSLIIWGYSIADLTGIEDFTSLVVLYCFDNQLTTLDLSQNTNISDLRCYNNQLTSINVTQCPNLSTFLCNTNPLATLDVTQNPALNDFRCFDTNLSSLDVTQNTSLDMLFCYDAQLTSLDVTQNVALTDLRCFGNQLTTLDVTQNTALVNLFCYDNDLTTLDVTQNTGLDLLFCQINKLNALDVSQNSVLTGLRCYDNLLTSLDVTQNLGLTLLWCWDNQLQCLSANNGQNMTLDCTNNQLSCVSFVDPAWAYSNTSYDAGVTFQIQCLFMINNDVVQNGTNLTAEQNGASYQWFDCSAMDGPLPGETNQTFTPTTTGYYCVEITYTHPCGGTQVDTSSCHLVDYTSLDELTKDGAELVGITDLIGREVPFKPNTPLLYIYSDGTIERVFKIEE